MKKRFLSLFLTFVMICSLFTGMTFTAFAQNSQDFSDMPDKSSWSYEALKSAVANGLLNGADGKLLPNNKLTRAQMAAIINRSFGAEYSEDISQFTDVSVEAWYYNDIAKAVRMGTFKGDGSLMRPDNAISRQEAFVVLARAFKLEEGNKDELGKFSDYNSISDWAAPALASMVKSGYINGNNGKINPLDTITRAEFAQVMYNMLQGYCNEAKVYTEIPSGNIMINEKGITLKDVTVSGDLIIGEGVGDGEATLDGVEVKGRMIVRGGGENSVILKNNSTVGSVLVGKTGDGGVRIRTEEGCRIEALIIDDGKDDIILEGDFNQVAVATDAPVILRNADVTGLTVKSAAANVSLNGTTKVTTVQVTEGAAGAAVEVGKTAEVTNIISKAEKLSVSGEGAVKSAEISGNNTVIDTKGTSLTVKEGTEGVKQNGNSVESGKTVATGKQNGEAGGSGGSGGGGGGGDSHVHIWNSGIITVTPTCVTEGVRTYSCTSCNQTKTEKIAALEHEWDEGEIITSPTDETDGVMEFHCKRQGCNGIKTEPVSKTPYRITLNEGSQNESILKFETLEAAIAEAEKHPYYNPPSEEPWIEYETIVLAGSDVIGDLVLPAGYNLFVGGQLTVTGDIKLGASDYALTNGRGAARVFVPTYKDGKTFSSASLTWKNTKIVNGLNEQDGVISHYVSESLGEKNDTFEVVTLFGARDKDASSNGSQVFENPWISFNGFYGQNCCFSINKDFDFRDMFDGVMIDSITNQVVANANVTFGQYMFTGEENPDGTVIVLEDGKSSVSLFDGNHKKIKVGFSDDCNIQLKNLGGDNTDGVIVLGDNYNMAMGGNVIFNKACSIDNVTIRPYFGPDPNTYTVTIPENVEVDLSNCQFENKVNVINNGILNISGNVNINAEFTNNGTVNINDTMNVESRMINNGKLNVKINKNKENYDCGRLIINTGGGFENNGNVSIEGKYIGDDERRFARVSFYGGNLINGKNGTILNNGRIEMETSDDTFVRENESEEFKKESNSGVSSLRNEGQITNNGTLAVQCNDDVNDGVINNNGVIILSNTLKADLYTTLEHKMYVEPGTEEEEDLFYNKLWRWAEEEGYYWGIKSATASNVSCLKGDFVNKGTINNNNTLICRNITLKNEAGAVIDNEAHIGVENFTPEDYCRWDNKESLVGISYPEFSFINSGTFANGSITNVGEGSNGSQVQYDQTNGVFTNNTDGVVTNNGNLKLNYVNLTNRGNFETYNSAGMEIRGGTQDITETIYNEGYMKVVDEYYDAGGQNSKNMICGNLSNVKSKTRNDSDWIDWTAAVYSEEGLLAAEAVQNSSNIYNRLDFCEDFVITGSKKLSAFKDYWVQTRYDEENDENVGVTLTIDGILTIDNNSNLNISGWYNRDDDCAVPELVINSGGKLIIAGEIQEERDNHGDIIKQHENPGNLVLWSVSGYRNNGEIENMGNFEIYYEEGLINEGELSHFGKLHGPHNNSFNTADIHTFEGMKYAANNENGYNRITIRTDSVISVTEDITVPSDIHNIYIEPGSGLIVESGNTLTFNCNWVENNGDISVYGNLIIGENCELKNNQNLEVGAINGSQESVLTVYGGLYNENTFRLYPMGELNIGKSARIYGIETVE